MTAATGVLRLLGGQQFTASVTGTNKGERFFREQEFIASHDQDVQHHFIPDRDGRIAQDRVYVEHERPRHGRQPQFRDPVSVPVLVVTGSIKVVGR